jgi:hypothetical protein
MADTWRDFSVQRSTSPVVSATERAASTAAFDVTRAIHCNDDATYEVTFQADSSSVTMDLKEGITYPFALVNITDSSGSALTAGAITLLY